MLEAHLVRFEVDGLRHYSELKLKGEFQTSIRLLGNRADLRSQELIYLLDKIIHRSSVNHKGLHLDKYTPTY